MNRPILTRQQFALGLKLHQDRLGWTRQAMADFLHIHINTYDQWAQCRGGEPSELAKWAAIEWLKKENKLTV